MITMIFNFICRVQELTEHVEKLEEDQRQYQDALSYKDNEIDVLKDCFVQLKAFERTDKDTIAEENEDGEEEEKKGILLLLKFIIIRNSWNNIVVYESLVSLLREAALKKNYK